MSRTDCTNRAAVTAQKNQALNAVGSENRLRSGPDVVQRVLEYTGNRAVVLGRDEQKALCSRKVGATSSVKAGTSFLATAAVWNGNGNQHEQLQDRSRGRTGKVCIGVLPKHQRP